MTTPSADENVTPVDTTPLTRSQKAKWIALLVIALVLVGAYFVVDLAGTSIVRTGAVVTGKYDIISWSHGTSGSRSPDQCRIKLLTIFGTLSDAYLGLCGGVPWAVGQPICIDVRVGRLSGSVLILHGPADFSGGGAGASSAPPTSVAGQIPKCDAQDK